MLTEICQYLHNWFNRKPDGSDYPKYSGAFEVVNGELDMDDLAEGQYFRIMGSLFNDGVHKKGEGDLKDESFDGEIWSMGVPPQIVALADNIGAWVKKYGGADGAALSPYQSESFDGYSYTKQASAGTSGGFGVSWSSVFGSSLAPWRKI